MKPCPALKNKEKKQGRCDLSKQEGEASNRKRNGDNERFQERED